MANKGLAALGRAAPALSQSWRDIVTTRQAGEEMALRRERFAQERAVSDLALERERLNLEATKQREAWLDQPVDITVHPTFLQLSQETQNKIRGDFTAQGIVDAQGRGKRRDVMNYVATMEQTPKLLDPYVQIEMKSRHQEVLKANEALQKELMNPGADPQKVEKLQAQLNMANEKYTGLLTNHKDYMEAMKSKANIDAMTQEIKRLQSEGRIKQIPPSVQEALTIALRNQDLTGVRNILEEWVKSELKQPEEKKWPQKKEEVLELEKEKSKLREKEKRAEIKPSDFDKKWEKAKQMAVEKFGKNPTVTQIAQIFKDKFAGAVNFLSQLLGETEPQPSGKTEKELVYDPKTGQFKKWPTAKETRDKQGPGFWMGDIGE